MTKKKDELETPNAGPDPQSPPEGEKPGAEKGPAGKAEVAAPADVPVEGKIARVDGALKKDGDNDEEKDAGEGFAGWQLVAAGLVAALLAGLVLWYYLRKRAEGTGADAN